MAVLKIILVNGDVNFDKHVHENMFTSLVEGFLNTGHIFEQNTGYQFRGWGISCQRALWNVLGV